MATESTEGHGKIKNNNKAIHNFPLSLTLSRRERGC
jgi:hypothetical protein